MHVYFLSEETTALRTRSWRVKGGVELKRQTVTIQVSFYHETQKQPECKTDKDTGSVPGSHDPYMS